MIAILLGCCRSNGVSDLHIGTVFGKVYMVFSPPSLNVVISDDNILLLDLMLR